MNAAGPRRVQAVGGGWLLGQLVGLWSPSHELASPAETSPAPGTWLFPPGMEMKHLSQGRIAPRGPFCSLSFVLPCFKRPEESWRAQAELRAVNDANVPGGTDAGFCGTSTSA